MNDESLLQTPQAEKWKKIGINRKSGMLFPLFAARSKKSAGIGDFRDLNLLVDFCAKTGNSILQLLPMNEMGTGFSPYDSISSFAIEPSYISIPADFKKRFKSKCSRTDFSIKGEKIKILRTIFEQDYWDTNLQFQRFIEENSYWLYDFALFKTLKDFFKDKPWDQWDQEYVEKDPRTLNIFRRAHANDIFFYMWLQWQAYCQFKEAKKYAEKKRVFIMGDLPVLLSRDSVDVWILRDYFKLQYSAGAPPDMYSSKGQRWGMPTNNWQNIEKDNYRYIKEKLRYAENFYDMLRIDHVLGLFRIWSIPFNEPVETGGLNGFFDPGDEILWEEHGRKILSMMSGSTKTLLCAEDLGVIPPVCPKVLKELAIPGTDVARWKQDDRFLSIATLSIHDTTNWKAWWENEATPEEKEKLWKEFKMKDKPSKKSTSKLLRSALKHNLSSNSIFSIQVIFDWLGIDNILKGTPSKWRINTPGTISEKNWTIVIPVYMEKLLKNKICNKIKKLIKNAGRL